MITSISVAKEDIEDMEFLKSWCRENGISKSWLIMKLVRRWAKEVRDASKS